MRLQQEGTKLKLRLTPDITLRAIYINAKSDFVNGYLSFALILIMLSNNARSYLQG